jgi:hypothetical protein
MSTKNVGVFFSLWSLGDHDVVATAFQLNRLKLKRFKLPPSWV